MSLLLALLLLLGLAALLLALSPLGKSALTPTDDSSQPLEEEREALLRAITALDGEGGEEAAHERARLRARAARVLTQLDQQEPQPSARLHRPLLPAMIGVGLALLVVGIGAFTFIPRWQLAALDPNEAAAVKSVVQLPALASAAARSGSEADQLKFARTAFSAGRYDDAVGAYSALLRKNPRQAEGLRRLGLILLSENKDTTQAAQLIQAAAQLAPGDPESQLYLGFALSRFGENARAITALTRYQTLKPDGHDADSLLAQLRSQSGAPVSAGQRVYAANCASCHGPAGAGGIGPNLRAAGLTESTITAVIRNGKGTMPAFPNLSAADLKAVTGLVMSWQKAN